MIRKIIFPIIVLLLVSAGCVDYQMQSERTNSKINIDGNDDDWQGKLQFFKDERFAIGFQNDDENLYMCITTNDKNKARKFLMPGMNIWFDTGSENTYAIRFPLFDPEQMPRRKNNNEGNPSERNNIFRNILADQHSFLVVNEDDYPMGTYSIDGNSGVKLKVGMTKDKFVFELQYALTPYNDKIVNSLDLKGKKELKVSFESVEFNRSFSGAGARMGGGPDDGMGSGIGGGMRPGGTGQRPGMNRLSEEDINFSVDVVLAD